MNHVCSTLPITFPALAQTSQQLREEVLPIYFTTTTFFLAVEMDHYDKYKKQSYDDTTAEVVQHWDHTFVGSSTMHLRKLVFDLTVLQRGHYALEWPISRLESSFSQRRSYRVDYAENLKTTSKEQLERHVAKIEAIRKEKGDQGQCILGALIDCHHLWDYTMFWLEDED